MSNVRRIYVEKKEPYAVKAKELHDELKNYLGIDVAKVREFIRYDVENISDEVFARACKTVFSEPPVDDLYEETIEIPADAKVFSVEFLPGQFDQRADSAVQCVKFLKEDEEPVIRTAVTYMIEGQVSDEEFSKIKSYCINPVDSRETGMEKPDTLITVYDDPADVAVFDGFRDMDESSLKALYESLGLAMTFKDFLHIQKYFHDDEKRDPSMTEIRVLDTYWSDHCRHTTFSTELTDVEFGEGYYRSPLETTYQSYLDTREEIFKGREDKFVCLMDLALMAMRKLKKDGKLDDMEESDEINACSVVVPVEMDYGDHRETEEWLVFFKNETHNHPTEIEPFGGAATCLGGAIRDPLSGRGYVYQAMRVTGAADPTVPVSETLHGKLSQKKLVRGAASGYSSYGNQIGLATGFVKEIYHPSYVAKRMEIGAVMGAAPRRNVIRETSDPGDIIILLGGRTGRDGCGGATGSSKVHTDTSIETCGAEVQKGNAPTERKIQRLFRREEVSRLIKKCNDFGAGGVSVAIGELADGLTVDLDKVPKKYAGLDGTELAISESQERMAVVVDPKDVDTFLGYAKEENLEAVPVAVVTEEPRLVLNWRGKPIVDLKRAFLDTNGAHQETRVKVDIPSEEENYFDKWAVPAVGEKLEEGDVKGAWVALLNDLNVCSQKGLVEMFDSTIGASTVLLPFGGRTQRSETQVSVQKLPTDGYTDTASIMAFGYNPFLASWSPYHGAAYAVVDAAAKVVAAGARYDKMRYSYQEYFERMTKSPRTWGKPLGALLGALKMQVELGLPSIGGKDSMSGTFEQINVPPMLMAFGITTVDAGRVISTDFKKAGHSIYLVRHTPLENHMPDTGALKRNFDFVSSAIESGKIVSGYAVGFGGVAEALAKMSFGNGIGADVKVDEATLFDNSYGSIVVESTEPLDFPAAELLGHTEAEGALTINGEKMPLEELYRANTERFATVYPDKGINHAPVMEAMPAPRSFTYPGEAVERPEVFIPVFPGSNCDYDTAKAFRRAGAEVRSEVFCNLTAEAIFDSIRRMKEAIAACHIFVLCGGFSAGDEPDGSGKFIANVLNNKDISEEIHRLLDRGGLILGICNGFQALVKSGLLPYGRLGLVTRESPTLFRNDINRHVSQIVSTRVATTNSPWLSSFSVGDIHSIAVSHGEGKFVVSEPLARELFENGQVAFQYVDAEGRVTAEAPYNPNGSYYAIEGIVSRDGQILGKMGHTERYGENLFKNIAGEKVQDIFTNAVNYFRKTK